MSTKKQLSVFLLIFFLLFEDKMAAFYNTTNNYLSTIRTGMSRLRYEKPDDCTLHDFHNLEVKLVCNLRTINSEYDTTNFTVIPTQSTVSLSIVCDNQVVTKSKLTPQSFVHLTFLKELSIEYCKLDRLNNSVFIGLNYLKNLTIRTFNVDWPAINLDLDSKTFFNVTRLEQLDLSLNNIWSLPESIFCPLAGLRYLNLSGNRLQDINDLGFKEKTLKNVSSRSCAVDLEILDVSFNQFVLIPSNAFGALKRLKYLKIHNNELSMIADKSLEGLKELSSIYLNNNKIVALPSELFRDQQYSVEEIYLQDNKITVLSPNIFANLSQLQALDISRNQLTSAWIDKTTFKGLIRLVLLNLSYNQINKLDAYLFRDLYSLQVLNLRNNNLENLSADTFAFLNNLHKLYLSHNIFKRINADSLRYLDALNELAVDNNLLVDVHPDAFYNCSALEKLHLNMNNLTQVPLAVKNMRSLQELDLGENKIKNLEENDFQGMFNLQGLRLIGNYIENITKNIFKDQVNLQILNLAHNKIRIIEAGVFDGKFHLRAIRLDENELLSVEKLFQNVPNLTWLNVSNNNIENLDYLSLPPKLEWFDIHKNKIKELKLDNDNERNKNLRTLDISFNKITSITPDSFPNGIELLFLNDNLIKEIEPHCFTNKHKLIRVDLYANRLTSLSEKAFRLKPQKSETILPEFYIGGNPFICDCNIEWLKNTNNLITRTYPRIMDIDKIYCKLLYNRNQSYIQLINAQPLQFLCEYKIHCFALCQCCDFYACDCKMTCPENCTCYHDQSWSTNLVECTSAGYVEVPAEIPMDTTELYIDGNNLVELPAHIFIGRKNLRVLHANNSFINTIYNSTFYGLKKLSILHLENNQIKYLFGSEFVHLQNLAELYLQHNNLHFIASNTFIFMVELKILRLDSNNLINFEAWNLAFNPKLSKINLTFNNWTCECSYLNKFKLFINNHKEKVIQANEITCNYNNALNKVFDKNMSKCVYREGISSIIIKDQIEGILPLLLTFTSAFIGIFALIVGIVCYRKEIILWFQKFCFPLLCCESKHFLHKDDKDQCFDAYVIYSLQDESFVNQNFSHVLENSCGYHLFLHHRDIDLNKYVVESINEALLKSNKVLLILSRNFISNEWTRYEFKNIVHEIIKRRKKIIIILYGDLPQTELDTDMRFFLRSNTCIEWDDKLFWKKLKHTLPRFNNINSINKKFNIKDCTSSNELNSQGQGILLSSQDGSMHFGCNKYTTLRTYTTTNFGNTDMSLIVSQEVLKINLNVKEKFQHRYADPVNCLHQKKSRDNAIRVGKNSDENFTWTSSSSQVSSNTSSSLSLQPNCVVKNQNEPQINNEREIFVKTVKTFSGFSENDLLNSNNINLSKENPTFDLMSSLNLNDLNYNRKVSHLTQ